MSKVKSTRSILTWDELRAIEASAKYTPAYDAVRKLMKHIRFIEHMNGILADQIQAMKRRKASCDVGDKNA